MKQITLTARVWPEDDSFVAECVEYAVSSYGDTEQEALEMLIEAVELYLEDSATMTAPYTVRHFEIENRAA